MKKYCKKNICKKVRKDIESFDIRQLSKKLNDCELCGGSIWKHNKVYQETYEKISTLYAIKYMGIFF